MKCTTPTQIRGVKVKCATPTQIRGVKVKCATPTHCGVFIRHCMHTSVLNITHASDHVHAKMPQAFSWPPSQASAPPVFDCLQCTAYCKRSKTGGVEGPGSGTRLSYPVMYTVTYRQQSYKVLLSADKCDKSLHTHWMDSPSQDVLLVKVLMGETKRSNM